MRTAEDTTKWTRLFPELRIVKDDLFRAAQEMLQENVDRYSNHRSEDGRLNGSRPDLRGKKLLSNLIECEICHTKFVYKGQYLHCPNHNNGQCSCKTGLPRDLAERMILDTVIDLLLSSPEWLDDFERSLSIALAEQSERSPGERDTLQGQLADVERRRENLLRLAENGNAHADINQRLGELTVESAQVRKQIEEHDLHHRVPPEMLTHDEFLAELRNLAESMSGRADSLGPALRRLLGGRIVVSEKSKPGSKRMMLQGTIQLRLYEVARAIDRHQGVSELESPPLVTRTIDFVDPALIQQQEQIRARAWQLYQDGKFSKEIRKELHLTHNGVTKILREAAELHGEQYLDGRERRAAMDRKSIQPPRYQVIAPRVMELFQKDELYATISSDVNADINTIRKSVRWWHESRGLPAPDGRTRRKQLTRKSR